MAGLLSVLIFLAAALPATQYYPGVSTNYVLDSVPLDQELTLDKLMSAITTQHLNTIEDVAAFLPPEMKHYNYVVMFKSRSLQEASVTNPRIISYTPSARFVVTFNGGDPDMYGSDTIEMVQFDDKKSRFDFYELQFNDSGLPTLSQANPPRCLTCHQSAARLDIDPRPNWEPYDSWPGAFGSHSLEEGSFATPQEKKDYETYEMAALTNPRYRTFHSGPSLKAPTRLTESLAELNFLRVSRLILEHPAIYEKNKELMREFFEGSPSDKSLLEGPLKAPFAKLVAEGNPYAKPYYTHVTTSFFLALLFESEGVDTSDWSMDFRSRGGFSSIPNERFGTPLFTDRGFWAAFGYEMNSRPQLTNVKDVYYYGHDLISLGVIDNLNYWVTKL